MDEFENKFGPYLKSTIRWNAFCFIVDELCKRNRPINIIETGCVRVADNWKGDGQSTRIWDWLVRLTGGQAISLDLDQNACELARQLCPNVEIHCVNSIEFLAQIPLELGRSDLIYLDSYDFKPPYEPSKLHHAGELAVSYHHLESGCLIAVDDCYDVDHGKHSYVKMFFDEMGIPPVHQSYITVWRKP